MNDLPRHSLERDLPDAAAAAVDVVRRLRADGHEAYLVGGAVRDLLLNLRPGDFDVATSATPDEITALFPGSDLVGASFGVCIVKSQGEAVETATFRTEGPYGDGRHPDEVAFSLDLREDAARRDFTVNALFLDPVAGEIIDPVGGVADCRDRVLRAVGEPRQRFGEDGLRLMRAARFASACGLSVDPGTREAMHACRTQIDRIAAERIGDELDRTLTGPDPAAALELLDATGVLERILPELPKLRGLPQPERYHPEGDVWTHTMLMLDRLESPEPALAWAVLLHDIAKPDTFTDTDRIRFHGHARLGARMSREILGRLRRPRALAGTVADLIDSHQRFLDVMKMRPATLKRFLRRRDFTLLLELHRLDRLGSNGDLTHWSFCRSRLAELAETELSPEPLLDGGDLRALGYEPGPRFGEILEALETEQLEGRLTDADAARAWLRRRFPID